MTGRAMVLINDGAQIELKAGDFFHVGPGHESWIGGDHPYFSLHFLGAEAYAT
jgi:hypothetical protein